VVRRARSDVASGFQTLVQHAGVDVWRADASGRLLADLPLWRSHTGQSAEELLGHGWLEAVHAGDRDATAAAWQEAVERDEPLACAFAIVKADGDRRRLVLQASPVAARGGTREWLGVVVDVTDSLEAADLRLEVRTAETLQRIGSALVSELDLEKVVQLVTDAATELIGADFGAFFYNVHEPGGESYLLYSLSGAAAEDFSAFPMPRNTPLFEPTFRGEGVIRLADVTAEPRYGQIPPYHGMPPGHVPVRSYLAVPVISRSGEVLGGLFFGHRHPEVFTAQHERLVVNIAAHAAIAIDNARLYQTAQREREAAQRLASRLSHLQAVSNQLAGAKEIGRASCRERVFQEV
jgi:PAS domain S-box-containing protein